MVAFFHKSFVKSHFNILTLEQWNYQKWVGSIFSGIFSVKQTFVQLEFVTAVLSLAHITNTNKNKYLVFAKLKNISQIKWIFLQIFLKIERGVILRKWAKKISNFQVSTNFTVRFRNWYP